MILAPSIRLTFPVTTHCFRKTNTDSALSVQGDPSIRLVLPEFLLEGDFRI